jgi:hypothetical protein
VCVKFSKLPALVMAAGAPRTAFGENRGYRPDATNATAG